MSKRFGFVAILLTIVMIVSIAGCGGKSKTSKSKSVIQEATALDSTPASVPSSVAPSSTVESEDVPVQQRILPANEFGRDNPFVPLVVMVGGKSIISEKKPMTSEISQITKPIARKPEPPPAPPLPNVRLSLVIDGSTAIFEDNKASKVASIGDTVSGMKLLEIHGNEAVFSSGTERFFVSPGGIRKESPVPAQNSNVPKGSKIKKK